MAGGSALEFAKYSGAGNDFIIIDGSGYLPDVPPDELARRLCRRAVSVGADGLIVIRRCRDGDADLEWEFYNADGSAAEFCGNGVRCAARFAVRRGLVGSRSLTIKTAAGIVRATVGDGDVRIEFGFQPAGIERMSLTLERGRVEGFFIEVGVPHFVVFVDDLNGVPVRELGRSIRRHPGFAPRGTNVDFCKLDGGRVFIRTYERGVEDETLACGSGAMAAALVARAVVGLPGRVGIVPRSGEPLTVDMSMIDRGVLALEGPAREVYSGTLVEPWSGEI